MSIHGVTKPLGHYCTNTVLYSTHIVLYTSIIHMYSIVHEFFHEFNNLFLESVLWWLVTHFWEKIRVFFSETHSAVLFDENLTNLTSLIVSIEYVHCVNWIETVCPLSPLNNGHHPQFWMMSNGRSMYIVSFDPMDTANNPTEPFIKKERGFKCWGLWKLIRRGQTITKANIDILRTILG